MGRGKAGLTVVVIFLTSFLLSNNGFSQGKRGEDTVSFSGRIEDVSRDHKSIIVHGQRLSISQETKIVDQKGNRLRSDDLKTNLHVAVDAVPHPNGYIAKEVVLIKDRGV